MRLFHLQSLEHDQLVALGVLFPDGQVVLQWQYAYRSWGIYQSLEVVELTVLPDHYRLVWDEPSTVQVHLTDLPEADREAVVRSIVGKLGSGFLPPPPDPTRHPFLGMPDGA